jgi:rRNA maturation endonuclease Nob1
MARKAKNTNKRCPVCAVIFRPQLTKCPKCGHEPLKMPKFVGERKPLTSGGKLKLKPTE